MATPSRDGRSRALRLSALAALTVLYFLGGKLGLTLAVVHESASAVWPPTGIALAACLLWGYGVWPAILLGAFLVNVTTTGAPATSLGIALGNTLEGVLGAYLVNRFAHGTRAFEHPRDVFMFAWLAAIVSTMVSASCGLATLSLSGLAAWEGSIWFTWWLGDAAGALTVAPVLVLWSVEPRWSWRGARLLELLLLLSMLALAGLFVFTRVLVSAGYPLQVLCVPMLLWAAFRFGPREAATSTLLISVIAVWGTLQTFEPYARTSWHVSLLLLQAFMGIWAVMALAVAAVVEQRRRSEAEIRRLNQELERRVDGEQAARREAEEANRLKEDFLATLSHELRTPLNAIVGWGYLLKETALDGADARKAIAAIGRNTQALTRLIEDLLDISRAASGRLALELRTHRSRAVIQSAVETVQHDAEARSVRLEPSFTGSGPMIQADHERLEQVVWNLLSNAIKFSPAGGRVRVSLARAVAGQLEIRVEDEGPGIEPAFLSHVFERFRLADASTTRRQGGLGLGLAIVRNLVDLHGGSVSAANRTSGTGAIFTVRLPEPHDVGADAGVRPNALADAAGAERDAPPSLQGLRVLVVDDEADGREAVIAVLERSGAQVAAAGSAAEGLWTIETFRPDVVLSDIQMPGEDGIAFVRRLRALTPERGGLTPAAAVTAHAGPQERAMALDAGYQLHIAKPVDPAELVRAVVALVDARPTGRW